MAEIAPELVRMTSEGGSARSIERIKRELVKRHAEDEEAHYDIRDPVHDLI